MDIRRYLPSTSFSFIVLALAVAVLLVWGAREVTKPPQTATLSLGTSSAKNTNWQEQLQAFIDATSRTNGTSNPVALLQDNSTGNLTDDIGRALLLNATAASGGEISFDSLTQDKIIASAIKNLPTYENTLYTAKNIRTVPDTNEVLHQYANNVIAVLNRHTVASVQDTQLAFSIAVESGDTTSLGKLKIIAADYEGIARDLAALEVPRSLSPLHLQIVNNFAKQGLACTDMQAVIADPLRGLAAFESYRLSIQENDGVFTLIREHIIKSGILFNENEPGRAWVLPAS